MDWRHLEFGPEIEQMRAVRDLPGLGILNDVDANRCFIDESGMHELEREAALLFEPISQLRPIADISILIVTKTRERLSNRFRRREWFRGERLREFSDCLGIEASRRSPDCRWAC